MAKRRKKKQQPLWVRVVGVLVALALLGAHEWRKNDGVADSPTAEVVATPDQPGLPAALTDRPEEIVRHEGFTLSYNNQHLVPNWVAWVLTAERVAGTEKRAENFQPDESIRRGPTPQLADYRRSGYDRGHMCPAADCKHSRASQNECFLLSNMCPQNHTLNAGDWEELESLCRKWAVAYDSIMIVCGPVLQPGRHYATIGDNRVTVPEMFYKVVMRYNGQTIGFIMNNDESNRPVSSYAVSVDSVERLTGIDFFPGLPEDCEATYSPHLWRGL